MTHTSQLRNVIANAIEVIANKVENSPSRQYIWAVIDNMRWIIERIDMSKPVTLKNLKIWNEESGEKKLSDFSIDKLAKLADEMEDDKGVLYEALLICSEEGVGKKYGKKGLSIVGRKEYFTELEAWVYGVKYDRYKWEVDMRYTYWMEVREEKMSTWEMNYRKWQMIQEDIRQHFHDEGKMLSKEELLRRTNDVYKLQFIKEKLDRES